MQEYKIIVAIGENNEIGDGEDLLWHLPADMKYFKEKHTRRRCTHGKKNL